MNPLARALLKIKTDFFVIYHKWVKINGRNYPASCVEYFTNPKSAVDFATQKLKEGYFKIKIK